MASFVAPALNSLARDALADTLVEDIHSFLADFFSDEPHPSDDEFDSGIL